MPTLYRVISPDGTALGEGNSIEEAIELVKQATPGRYQVDLVPDGTDADSGPARNWGEIIKTIRGRIKLNAPPWAD